MPYDPRRHHRRSIRLRGYDYAAAGLYFVTIDVQGGECVFGEIADGRMQPNEMGQVVEAVRDELAARFPGVSVHAFVLMPNHVHAVIAIDEPAPQTMAGEADAAAVGAGSPRPPCASAPNANGATPGAADGALADAEGLGAATAPLRATDDPDTATVGAGSPRPACASAPNVDGATPGAVDGAIADAGNLGAATAPLRTTGDPATATVGAGFPRPACDMAGMADGATPSAADGALADTQEEDTATVGAGSPHPACTSALKGDGATVPAGPPRPTLGQIVAYLKYQSGKRINALRSTPSARLWQRNYYERIVRDQAEYDRACQYVVENPLHWDEDSENPANTGAKAKT